MMGNKPVGQLVLVAVTRQLCFLAHSLQHCVRLIMKDAACVRLRKRVDLGVEILFRRCGLSLCAPNFEMDIQLDCKAKQDVSYSL